MPSGIRNKTPDDDAWLEAFLQAQWGGPVVVNRGVRHNLLELPALIAERGGERCGLLTYRIEPEGWQITTNDNIDALRFDQRRGVALVAVHPRAVDEARRLKPGIPTVGDYGIPIRDKLELERRL